MQSAAKPARGAWVRWAYWLRYLFVPGVVLTATAGLLWAIFPYHRTGNEVQAGWFITLFVVGLPLVVLGAWATIRVGGHFRRWSGVLLALSGAIWVAGYAAGMIGLGDIGFILLMGWPVPFVLGLPGLASITRQQTTFTFRTGVLLLVLGGLAVPFTGFLFELTLVLLLPGGILLGIGMQMNNARRGAFVLLASCLLAAMGVVASMFPLPFAAGMMFFLPFGVAWVFIGIELGRTRDEINDSNKT